MENIATIDAIGLYESTAQLTLRYPEEGATRNRLASYTAIARHLDWTHVCVFAPLTDFRPGGWKTVVDDVDLNSGDYDQARRQASIASSRPEGGATWYLDLEQVSSEGCATTFEVGMRNVCRGTGVEGARTSIDHFVGALPDGAFAASLDADFVRARAASRLSFSPRRHKRESGPVVLVHAIDVPCGFKSTNVLACFVDGPFVDYGYVDVVRVASGGDDQASVAFWTLHSCIDCERRGREGSCCHREALACLPPCDKGVGSLLGCHEFLDWADLPDYLRANIARSRPPALWCKDVQWDDSVRRRHPSMPWHVTMAGVMSRERKLTPWTQIPLLRQGYDTKGSLDRREVPANLFMGPPPDVPFVYRVGYVDRDVFHEPMFMVLFPRVVGLRDGGHDLTKEQRASFRKGLYYAEDGNIAEGYEQWVDNYLTVRAYRSRRNLNQGRADDDVWPEMPDDLVFHMLGQLGRKPTSFHKVKWQRGHYPTVVVGWASAMSAKAEAVPVYTFDGATVRTRMAKIVISSHAVGHRVMVRFEACLECRSYPKDDSLRGEVRTCECDDLKCVPHMGCAGVGHCIVTTVAVAPMSLLPIAVQDAVQGWRMALGTASWAEWCYRRSVQRSSLARAGGADVPKVVIPRNRVRTLDPELRDFWASKGVLTLPADDLDSVTQTEKQEYDLNESSDTILRGARSDEMEELGPDGFHPVTAWPPVDDVMSTDDEELEQL